VHLTGQRRALVLQYPSVGRSRLFGLESTVIYPRQTTLARRALLRGLALLAYPVMSAAPSPVSAQSGDAPVPITLPLDDGPHDAYIEWWYFTGHLFTESGERYGFEFVVFTGERGGLPGYVSHFAITDNALNAFSFDQRLAFVTPATTDGFSDGFDLIVGSWSMKGSGGRDALQASMDGYAIDLIVEAMKPPALHDGDGYIDYSAGEASYYYSRTRMDVRGELTTAGGAAAVTGQAWFDHQWGRFSTFEEGGWDWFAVQLDDGSDVMLYLITAPDGSLRVVDGSIVDPDGVLTVLDQGDFTVESTGSWTSERTGISYPSGWNVQAPGAELILEITPSLLDQELDTRATTGVIYWEGEVIVEGTRAGDPVAGLGYVELTGYADR